MENINTITKESNTSTSAELYFREKKQTTFKVNATRDVVEFLETNAKDNRGIFCEVSLSSYKMAMDKGVKGKILFTAEFGKKQSLEVANEDDSSLSDIDEEEETAMPSRRAVEEWSDSSKPLKVKKPLKTNKYLWKTRHHLTLDPTATRKKKNNKPKITKKKLIIFAQKGHCHNNKTPKTIQEYNEQLKSEFREDTQKQEKQISTEFDNHTTCSQCKELCSMRQILLCLECKKLFCVSCIHLVPYCYELGSSSNSTHCNSCHIELFKRRAPDLCINQVMSFNAPASERGFTNSIVPTFG